MGLLFTLLFLASIVLFFVTLFKPEKVMFWTQNKKRWYGLLAYGFAALFFLIASVAVDRDKPPSGTSTVDKGKESIVVDGKYIPGLEAVDIYLNLEKKGFKVKHEKNDLQEWWNCTSQMDSNDLQVEIFGKSYNKITAVHVTALNSFGINNTIKEFLGYVASLPYSGSKPEEAKKWVENSFNGNNTTIINGVQFETYAKTPYSRILIIKPKKI